MCVGLNEELVSLTEACKLLPVRRRGKKPSISCLYRWSTAGCRGVILETTQCGGTRVTSREALGRFFQRLSGKQPESAEFSVPPCPSPRAGESGCRTGTHPGRNLTQSNKPSAVEANCPPTAWREITVTIVSPQRRRGKKCTRKAVAPSKKSNRQFCQLRQPNPSIPAHVDEVLSRLDKVTQSSTTKWSARCPAHDDRNPSLTVGIGEKRQVLLCCHSAGCTLEQILEAMDLSPADLYARSPSSNGKPLTLKALAKDKALPPQSLEKFGVHEENSRVRIDYFLTDGSLAPRHRVRTSLVAKEGSKWSGQKEDDIVCYGLGRLGEAQTQGHLILVEGESDCWTLWHHGYPALGIPGANQAQLIQRDYLKGIKKVYYVREPDTGGDRFARGVADRLRRLKYEGQVLEISLSPAKDANDLHKRNVRRFKSVFQKALERRHNG